MLGRGGMGVVYLATQKSMNRQVAVKVLHPSALARPQAVKRFLREARTVSKLLHPNIVTVFEFGRTPKDELYIVMELLQGRTLAEELKEGAIDCNRAVHIVAQACDAIHHAHESDLFHRDLKPDNLFLLTSSARQPDFVKVLDFGIAREGNQARVDRLTETDVICGTPSYMAPEQILGDPLSPATDVYALGVTAFEALTGKRPFKAPSKMRMLMAHLDQPAPTFASLGVEGLPGGLEEAVRWALNKRPELRPASVLDFADALVDSLPQDSGSRRKSLSKPVVGPAAEVGFTTGNPLNGTQKKPPRTRTVDSLAVRELKAEVAAEKPVTKLAGGEHPTTDTGESIDTAAVLKERSAVRTSRKWGKYRVGAALVAVAGITAYAGSVMTEGAPMSQAVASAPAGGAIQDGPQTRTGTDDSNRAAASDRSVKIARAAISEETPLVERSAVAPPKVRDEPKAMEPTPKPKVERLAGAVVPVAVAPPVTTPPPVVTKRRCVVTVRPSSATIYVSGKRLGVRVVTLDAPHGDKQVVAVVKRKGYRTERVKLGSDCEPVTVRLSRLPRSATSKKGPKGTGIIE